MFIDIRIDIRITKGLCSMSKLDWLDKAILAKLTDGRRRSIREIARELEIPPSTIHERIKKLESRGIIKRYTAVLDEGKLGYMVKALILINVDGKHILDVEREIAENPNVEIVLDITGEFDIAVLAVFRNISELDNFVKKLLKNPYIKQTRTSIAFRTIKHEINPPIH